MGKLEGKNNIHIDLIKYWRNNILDWKLEDQKKIIKKHKEEDFLHVKTFLLEAWKKVKKNKRL